MLSSEHDMAAATLELTTALVTFIRLNRTIPVTNPTNDEGWLMRPHLGEKLLTIDGC